MRAREGGGAGRGSYVCTVSSREGGTGHGTRCTRGWRVYAPQCGNVPVSHNARDQVQHQRLVRRVHARRDLVKQQRPRLHGQRGGEGHALLLAAAQVPRQARHPHVRVVEADLRQHGAHHAAHHALVRAPVVRVVRARRGHRDGHVDRDRRQRQAVGRVLDQEAARARGARAAQVRQAQAVQRGEERGLSAAVRARDHGQLARRDEEGDVAQRGAAVRPPEAQVRRRDGGGGRGGGAGGRGGTGAAPGGRQARAE